MTIRPGGAEDDEIERGSMVHGGRLSADELAAGLSRDGQPLPLRAIAAAPGADGLVLDGEESPEGAQAVLMELSREPSRERRPPRGRRRSRPADKRYGRYTRARLPQGNSDIALDATLRAAASAQRSRRASAGRTGGLAIHVRPQDLREKHRTRKVGRLLVFLVDISGSMGGEIMALAKRAALFLLKEAYLKRDRVAMIAFREERAELLFAPTSSVEIARSRLAGLPTGGKTPLAVGLARAYDLVRRAIREDDFLEPVLILISDCKANVGSRPGYGAILAELDRIAAVFRLERRLRVALFDATEEGKNDFHASRLAGALAALRLKVHRLRGLDDFQMREVLRRI